MTKGKAMTLEQLIASLRQARDAKITASRSARGKLTELRARIDTTTPPTEDELRAAVDERDAADREVDALSARIDELVEDAKRQSVLDGMQSQLSDTLPAQRGVPYDRAARIGAEARTYSPGTDRTGRQFIRDVQAVFAPGGALASGSVDRLRRHMDEEAVERASYFDRDRIGAIDAAAERAVGTTAFAGLTVPQYLVDLVAPLARAGRPFADAINRHDLPAEGMTLELSRITTGTDVDTQSTQNSAVAEQNLDDTVLSVAVLTNAGQQTMSLQAQRRGTGTEDVTIQDLVRAYHSRLDRRLIQEATIGLSAVATSVAYTDATPTVAEAFPKLVESVAGVEGAMLDMASGENLAVMHSRRWYWLQQGLSASQPLISQPGVMAQMLGANYGETYGRGVRGVLPNGTAVIVDNNVATNLGAGTNEDEIYTVDRNECHLWEDPQAPLFIRAEQTAAASLGVLLVVYGFFGFTHSRYAHSRKVAGTGLITPSYTGV
jgi:hypothetical protein